MSAYDDLRAGGFNEGEIADHVWRSEGDELKLAGFSQDEITSHITGLAQPGRLAEPALTRLASNANGNGLTLNVPPAVTAEAQAAVPYHTQALADGAVAAHQEMPSLPDVLLHGILRGGADLGETAAIMGGRTRDTRVKGPEEAPFEWSSLVTHPGDELKKLLFQFSYNWPGTAAFLAGDLLAGGIGSVIGPEGTVGGLAVGLGTTGPAMAGLATGFQSFANLYYDEAAKNPEGAYDRAAWKARQEGVFTAATFGLFKIPLFRSAVERTLADATQHLAARGIVGDAAKQQLAPLITQKGMATVKDLAAQAGLIQPGAAVLEHGITNLEEGRPFTEGMGEAAASGALGAAGPMLATEAARLGWRGAKAAPGAVARTYGETRGWTKAEPLDLNALADQMRAENDKLIKQGLVQQGGKLERINPQTGQPEAIGHGVPDAQDFTDTARALGGGEVKPEIRDGLIKRWENDGIHPAEIARDAQIDPSLARFGEPPAEPTPPPLTPRDPPPAQDRMAALRLPFRLPPIRVEPPRLAPPEVPERLPPKEPPPTAPTPPPPTAAPPTPERPIMPVPPPPPEVPAPSLPPVAPPTAEPPVTPPPPPQRRPEERLPPSELPRPGIDERPPMRLPTEEISEEPTVRPPEEEEAPPKEAPSVEPVFPETVPEARPPEMAAPGEPLPDVSRETEPLQAIRPIAPDFEPNAYERMGDPPPPSNMNVGDTGIYWEQWRAREAAAEPVEGDVSMIWTARDEQANVLAAIRAEWDNERQRYRYTATMFDAEKAAREPHTFDNVDDAQHYVERMVRGGRFDDEGHQRALRETQERDTMRDLLRPLRKGELPEPKGFFDRIWDNYANRMTPEEFLRSEPAWSGARTLAEAFGWREHEAFSYLANEMFSRMGAPAAMTPEAARRFMGRERGIRAVPDEEAPRTLTSIREQFLQNVRLLAYQNMTPEAQAHWRAIGETIYKEIERMLGEDFADIDLHVLQGLPGKVKQYGRAAYGRGAVIAGRADLAKRLIEVALGARGAEATGAHEGFHIWHNELATDREIQILKRATEELRPVANRELKVGPRDLANWPDYEIWTSAYEVYRNDRKAGVPHYVRPVFDRILNFYERIKNDLRGLGFRTVSDIYRDVYEGRATYRDRPVRTSSGLDYGQNLPAALREGIEPLASVKRSEDDGYFTTASGERYALHPEGSTMRSGQARSEKTYYATPENADILQPPKRRQWAVIDHGNNKLSVATKRHDGEWIAAEDISDIPVETKPRPGLVPVQLFKSGLIKGRTSYSKAHFGQAITEVRAPRQALPEPVARIDDAVRQAADAVAARQGGIGTVFIGDIIDSLRGSRMTVAQIHDAILREAREGRATLAEASTVKVTEAQQQGAIRLEGERPFHTVTFKGEARGKLPESAAEPWRELPPVKSGYVRFYHGGDNPQSGGSRWVTENPVYARDYRPGQQLHYVDIPDTWLRENVAKTFEDEGTGVRAPYAHFDAPERFAKQMKPVGEPRAVSEPAAAISDVAGDERAAAAAAAAARGGVPPGPAPEATPAAGRVRGPRATGRAAADPATWNIVEFLTSRENRQPGIQPIAELTDQLGANYMVPGMGRVFRSTGMSLDMALNVAKGGGYLPPDATVRDLVDAITNLRLKMGEMRRRPVDVAEEQAKVEQTLVNALGLDGTPEDPDDLRVFNYAATLMARGFERDPIKAFRLALRQDDQHGVATEPAPERRGQTILPGFDEEPGVAEPREGAPGEGEPVEDRAGAGPREPPPEGVEAREALRPPGERGGEAIGAERQAEESPPSQAQAQSAERSNNGLDDPVPAGSEREAWHDEENLAREAAANNPQIEWDMNGRAAAAHNEAVRRTDPGQLNEADWAALERERDLAQEAMMHGSAIVGEVEPAAVPGGPGDAWDGGPGAGGSGGGGRLTGGDSAKAFNEAFYGDPTRTRYLGLVARYLISPLGLSHLDTRFGRLWERLRGRATRVNELIQEGKTAFEAFNKLNPLSQDKVLRVLEMERLKGTSYDPSRTDISILNDEHPLAELTQHGSVAEISTKGEMDAYHALRQFFAKRWADVGRATKMKFGVDPRATAEQLRIIAEHSEGATAKKYAKLATVIAAVEDSERQGYVPFARWGDYYIHVKARPGEMLGGAMVGTKGATAFFRLVKTRSGMDDIMGWAPRMENHPEFGRMPEAAAQEITRLREIFPEGQYEIEHGQHIPTTDALRDIGLPVVDRLMTLIGGNVHDTLKAQYGKGTSADVIRSAELKFWDAALDSIYKQVTDEMKTGFKKRARNTPGYDRDFRRSIGQYMNWSADHIANLETRDDIERVMRDDIGSHPDPAVRAYAKNLMNELDRDPTVIEHMARHARQGAFVWALGGNLSSVVTALMHDPLKASAVLGATIGGQGRAVARLIPEMLNVLRATRFDKEFGLTIDPEALGLNPRLRAAVDDWNNKGLTRSHGARTLQGTEAITQGPGEFARTEAAGGFQRLMNYTASGMHIADLVNRLAPGLAAMREFTENPESLQRAHEYWSKYSEHYRLMAAREGVSPETMARHIIEFVGGMNDPHNRAPVMRGAAGSTVFQFRTYTSSYLSQLYFMMRRAGPEGRMAATMMLGQLALLGGASALPFAGTVKDGIDWLWETITGIAPTFEDDFNNTMEALGVPRWASVGALHGIPYSGLGVDMSTRIGFGEEMRRFTESPIGAFPSIGHRAITEAWNRYNTGQSAAAVMAGFAPNAIRSILLGAKVWPEQGVVTQYGQTVLSAKELTPWDQFYRVLGFQPAHIAQTYDDRNEIISKLRFNRSQSENLHARVASLVLERTKAANRGDTQAYNDLTNRLHATINSPAAQRLITDGPAFYRAVMDRVRQANAPEVAEIMRLPKSMRQPFIDKYRKQKAAAESLQ